MSSSPPKLVLCVIDAMAPEMLVRVADSGAAPVLARLLERGRYIPDCVAPFPSVTPVCAASIVTGVRQDQHRVPGMNWYLRATPAASVGAAGVGTDAGGVGVSGRGVGGVGTAGVGMGVGTAGASAGDAPAGGGEEESRYVEYGSSLRAAQRFGIARQLTDTIYNMNRAHLARETPTVFETLDDAGVRTAGTTYLMYRGRHRHEPQRDTTLARFVAGTLARHPVLGPRELFYADLFASRRTGCRTTLGMPGVRDRHSACVSAYLVENDLFDFLLLSLPDNDWHSHKRGPEGQLVSLAAADLQLARVMEAAGGIDAFLEEHAFIAMADHSQAPIAHAISLQDELAELGVLQPDGLDLLGALAGAVRGARRAGPRGGEPSEAPSPPRDGPAPRIAVCPSQRAAMVYALHLEERDAMRASVVTRALAIEGVELVCWLARDAHDAPTEAVLMRPARGELRFAPGGDLRDARGASWHLEGELSVLDARVQADNLLATPAYPDALARLWSALTCPTSGEVLLSAAPTYEFLDWGNAAHVGGGSHGSLHACDSLAPLILCGIDPPAREPRQWAVGDVAGLVLDHFLATPT